MGEHTHGLVTAQGHMHVGMGMRMRICSMQYVHMCMCTHGLVTAEGEKGGHRKLRRLERFAGEEAEEPLHLCACACVHVYAYAYAYAYMPICLCLCLESRHTAGEGFVTIRSRHALDSCARHRSVDAACTCECVMCIFAYRVDAACTCE